MWIDLFVCAPVTLFMVWLYAYSAHPQRPGWLIVLDRFWLVLSPLSAVAIIVIGHALARVEGMGLNVMLVAAAYLTLVTLLGIGWLVRVWQRNQQPTAGN